IELRREPLDLRMAVERAVELGRGDLDARQHTLTVNLPREAVPIHADGVRIAQAICNLLSNAGRYTSPGGHVAVSLTREADEALITVKDDGEGIASDLLESIFQPFVQENAGGDGLGLGLHLADRLVRMHGGSMRAQSPGKGEGATFEIRLPTTSAAVTTPIPQRTDAQLSLRVAVIEDQEDIRELTLLLLAKWGHETLWADRGEAGIDL